MDDKTIKVGALGGAVLLVANTIWHAEAGCTEQSIDACGYEIPHPLHVDPLEPQRQVVERPTAGITSGSMSMPPSSYEHLFDVVRRPSTNRHNVETYNNLAPLLASAALDDERSLNFVDGNTFQVVQTGQMLKRA